MQCKKFGCEEEATQHVIMIKYLGIEWETSLCAKHKAELRKDLGQ